MRLPSATLLALLSFTFIIFISCGKKDTCVAGTGGSVTLVCFPQHHGTPIYNYAKPGYPDSLFLKFNPPTDFVVTSNPSNYDLVLIGNQGDDFVSASNLKCGTYFVFMAGYDTLRALRVTGGLSYPITATSGSVNLNVAVTE